VFVREKMLARMPVLRIIAASDMPAGPAQSKVHPGVAHGQTLLATRAGRRYGLHGIEMGALLAGPGHDRIVPVTAQLVCAMLYRRARRQSAAQRLTLGLRSFFRRSFAFCQLLFRFAPHFHERIDQVIDRFMTLCLATHPNQGVEQTINGFNFFGHAAF
jgi:hypothetical protein